MKTLHILRRFPDFEISPRSQWFLQQIFGDINIARMWNIEIRFIRVADQLTRATAHYSMGFPRMHNDLFAVFIWHFIVNYAV